jgi:hypothetical protein
VLDRERVSTWLRRAAVVRNLARRSIPSVGQTSGIVGAANNIKNRALKNPIQRERRDVAPMTIIAPAAALNQGLGRLRDRQARSYARGTYETLPSCRARDRFSNEAAFALQALEAPAQLKAALRWRSLSRYRWIPSGASRHCGRFTFPRWRSRGHAGHKLLYYRPRDLTLHQP